MNKIVFSIDIEREGDFVYDGERIIKEAGDMAESEWVSVFAERIEEKYIRQSGPAWSGRFGRA